MTMKNILFHCIVISLSIVFILGFIYVATNIAAHIFVYLYIHG